MRNLRIIIFLYLSSGIGVYGLTSTLTRTTPSWCRARMLFMNCAVPIDFSYTRSDSSGTSIPAGPADGVAIDRS